MTLKDHTERYQRALVDLVEEFERFDQAPAKQQNWQDLDLQWWRLYDARHELAAYIRQRSVV